MSKFKRLVHKEKRRLEMYPKVHVRVFIGVASLGLDGLKLPKCFLNTVQLCTSLY